MNFLPILERELRIAAKKPLTYYSRSLSALVAISVTLGMLYAGFGGLLSAASIGKTVFSVLSFIGYFFVLLQGILVTADCLSEEKRDGTLGLLFLTDLKGYDIVLGKLVSNASRSFYCLLAAMPIPGLVFFVGGITWSNFFQMMLALVNALFFSATAGLFVSAISREERRAFGGACSLVIFFGLILPAIGFSLVHSLSPTVSPGFLIFSPVGAVLSALGKGSVSAIPNNLFGVSLLISHLMGWLFLFLASWFLPYSWQDKVVAGFRVRKFNRIIFAKVKNKRWLEFNPMLWLGQRHLRSWILIFALIAQSALIMVAVMIVDPLEWFNPVLIAMLGVSLHVHLNITTAIEACRAFIRDRRSGALELLLTSPLDEEEILRGRMLALKRRLLWPTLFVLFADLGLIIAGSWKMDVPEKILWVVCFVCGVGLFLANMYTLTWVGLWRSMKAKSMTRAIGQTIFYVLLVPWIALFGLIALFGALTQGNGFQIEMAAPALLCLVGMFALFHVAFAGWAASELQDRFRILAIEQFSPKAKPFRKRRPRAV